MSWLTQHDTDWTAQADHANVGAGSALADGWIDSFGNTWAVSGGKLVPGSTGDSQGFQNGRYLLRPTGEALADSRIDIDVVAHYAGSSGPMLRRQTGANTHYLTAMDPQSGGLITQYKVVAGATTALNSTLTINPTYNAAHTYRVEFTATGTSPTTLTTIVTDTTTSTVVGTLTQTDSQVGLQAAGQQGIAIWGLDPNTAFTRSTTYATAPSVVPGTLGFSTSDAAGPTLTYTGTTGGTAPVVNALYRSAVSGFVPPGAGTLIGTGLTYPYHDSAAPAGISYYKVYASDVTTLAATSNQQAASPWLPPLNIGFIGDSITAGYGATTSAPDNCAASLRKIRSQRVVNVINRGISGTKSSEWVPPSGYLTDAKTAMATAGVTLVSVMLGTNDAKTANAVSAATYGANLAAIAADLVASGYTVILHYPPYLVPTSAGWDESSLALLQAYGPQIDAICNGTTILQGDRLAYQYFAEHPSELGDGVHPSDTGTVSLGLLWATAIDRGGDAGLLAQVDANVRAMLPLATKAAHAVVR